MFKVKYCPPGIAKLTVKKVQTTLIHEFNIYIGNFIVQRKIVKTQNQFSVRNIILPTRHRQVKLNKSSNYIRPKFNVCIENSIAQCEILRTQDQFSVRCKVLPTRHRKINLKESSNYIDPRI